MTVNSVLPLTLILLQALFAGCAMKTDPATLIPELEATLTAFHQAASRADRAAYFAMMTENAIFLGTDGTERWTKAEFETLYGPMMDGGKGWTYTANERHIYPASESLAWFDEMLANEAYGPCRGSGVLQRTDAGWKIAQYNLSIPIPNDLAREFVDRIRSR